MHRQDVRLLGVGTLGHFLYGRGRSCMAAASLQCEVHSALSPCEVGWMMMMMRDGRTPRVAAQAKPSQLRLCSTLRPGGVKPSGFVDAAALLPFLHRIGCKCCFYRACAVSVPDSPQCVVIGRVNMPHTIRRSILTKSGMQASCKHISIEDKKEPPSTHLAVCEWWK